MGLILTCQLFKTGYNLIREIDSKEVSIFNLNGMTYSIRKKATTAKSSSSLQAPSVRPWRYACCTRQTDLQTFYQPLVRLVIADSRHFQNGNEQELPLSDDEEEAAGDESPYEGDVDSSDVAAVDIPEELPAPKKAEGSASSKHLPSVL
jgi:hypothetical protein